MHLKNIGIAFIFLMLGVLLCVGAAVHRYASPPHQAAQVLVSRPDYSGVLVIKVGTDEGSCFVAARRGNWWYVITARHVLVSGGPITVDGYEAEIVRMDPDKDVALIRFKAVGCTYPIYSFARAQVENPCVSVGWNSKSRLIYKGHIVCVDYRGYVAANGGVLPGCSGGALFDTEGHIIGVIVSSPQYGMQVFDNTVLYVPARFAEALIITIGTK